MLFIVVACFTNFVLNVPWTNISLRGFSAMISKLWWCVFPSFLEIWWLLQAISSWKEWMHRGAYAARYRTPCMGALCRCGVIPGNILGHSSPLRFAAASGALPSFWINSYSPLPLTICEEGYMLGVSLSCCLWIFSSIYCGRRSLDTTSLQRAHNLWDIEIENTLTSSQIQ